MSAHNGSDPAGLPPELLTAYVDGELAPAECRRVEAWLAEHPDARADVAAQRRLCRQFDEAAPPAPTEEQWADVMTRLERGLSPAPARFGGSRRRAAVMAAALVTAAAVVVLAVTLRNMPSPNPGRVGDLPAAEEPWPVVSPDDVEIVSMDDRDRGALLVGQPPVNEPVELVTAGDVRVSKLEPDDQGRLGRVHGLDGSGSPMFIMPPRSNVEDAP
jgi:hypothetical protein